MLNLEKLQKVITDNKNINFKELHKKCPLSVSKIVECFKKPFDSVAMAEHCSKKYKDDETSKYFNMEPYEIIEMWETAKKHGQDSGKCLDEYIGFILNNQNDEANNLYTQEKDITRMNKMSVFKHLYENEFVKNGFNFVCRELTLFDEQFKWKGRFDAIFEKNDIIFLIDWKNNEKISTENTYDNLFGPLYKYQASDLNSYTIQLYLYKYVLEKYYGIDKVVPLLCRVGTNDYQFYNPVIPYSVELVESILKFANKELNK
jgi:ATP-dependent exoDNAse (exonuclease V) beta subunit